MRTRFCVTVLVLTGFALAAPAGAATATWTASIAPTAHHRLPTGLLDIACPSATFCIGVNAGPPAVVEVRDGVPSAIALTLPIDGGNIKDASLAAIACSTPQWCVAVGQYDTYTGRVRPLFETYRSGTWHGTTASTNAHGMSAVACNRSTCLATGNWYADPYNDTAMLARDASGAWTDTGFGVAYGDTIDDPACTPDVGPCYAQVYHQYYAYPTNRAFAYPSASGWKQVNFPGPPGADLTTLNLGAMSCPTVNYCAAVGSYRDTGGAQHLVAEKLGHGRLSATEIPLPAAVAGGSDDVLPTDAACIEPARCVAGATFYDSTVHHEGLLVSNAGAGWTAETAPVPAGWDGTTVSITGVACSTAGFCVATGSAARDGIDRRPLTENWPNGPWRPAVVHLPADHPTGEFAAVSCRKTLCIGAGSTSGEPLLAIRG